MTNRNETTTATHEQRPRVVRKALVLLALGVALTTFLLLSNADDASAQNSYDHEVIELINEHRESIGRESLVISSSLSADSRTWSITMQNSGWGHDPNLPVGIAENIAFMFGTPGFDITVDPAWTGNAGPLPSYCNAKMDHTTAELTVCQWLNSTEGHRAAIEEASHRQIGVGSATSGNVATFTTARFSSQAPAPVASFAAPAQDARLCSGQEISWICPNSGKYRLRLGTSANGTEVMNQSTNATSLNVAPLPADRTLYATLMYRPNSGSWVTAATRTFSHCANPVELNTSRTLCSGDELSWSGPSSGRYKLRIGTNFDGTDAMNQGTSRRDVDAAPNLPTGVDLYVSLRHRGSDGVWTLQATEVYEPCSKPIEIISPNDNAQLCDNDLVDWVGRSSGRYRLRIGTSFDGTDVLNAPTYATKYNVGDVASTSGPLYVSLRHQTVPGGRWALHYVMELQSC